jgi:threonine dehydrogenase-like Zn-dependent dehydrogenase
LKGWTVTPRGLVWIDLRTRPQGSQWARLELIVGGVCATDYQLLSGYANFEGVIGHEFCARVCECAQPEWLGAQVVGDINVGCGNCPDARFCPHRQVLGIRNLDGVFADSFYLPLANLRRCDGLDPALACWAEPLAAALDVHRHLGPGQSVLVLGDGRLGSLIAATLVRAGHCVEVAGHHPEKLARLQGLGCKIVAQLGQQTWPNVVEVSGHPDGLALGLRATAPQGRLILKSTTASSSTLDCSEIVVKGLQIVGSRCGDIDLALEWLSQGRIDPRPWISAVVALADLPVAMQRRHFKLLVSGPGREPASVFAGCQ